MADPIDNKLVDKRVAHRYVRKGVVAEKDYDRYMTSLPDPADQAMPIEASMDGDDLDDLDEIEDAPPALAVAPEPAAPPAAPTAPTGDDQGGAPPTSQP
jgi:hypothetical protein